MPFLKITLTLRDKFILAFLLVVGFTGISAGLAGNYLINKLVIEETKERVSADLNAAWGIYEQELTNIRTKIQITAERFFLRKSLPKGDLHLIKTELDQILKNEGLDILFLTDAEGKIIYRAHNPEKEGDDFSSHPLVHLPLNKEIIQTAFIIPRNDISKEGERVARKAAFPLTPTSEVGQPLKQKEDIALMLGAGVPVLSKKGKLLGVLAGGVILNRNYGLVDKIKNLVFKKVSRKTEEVEVVTISLGDLRIATTYLDKQGNRAIGTRLSPEVSQKVLVEGKDFLERALVVDYWYIMAYAPIKNILGKPIGALGVGIFEEKYYYARGPQLVNRVVDITAFIDQKVAVNRVNTAQGPAGASGARLRAELARRKLRLPLLGDDDETANREYIKEFVLRPNREVGRQYGLEYAEQFHYIGPEPSPVEEYIKQHARPL